MEKRVFDEATKKKLYGLLSFRPDSFEVWTPDEFKFLDEALRPVFHVKQFSDEAKKKIRSDAKEDLFGIETMREACKSAFPYWKNLLTMPIEEGKEITYSQEAFSELTEAMIGIMYTKANQLTFGISKEEKEALELPQPSTSEQ